MEKQFHNRLKAILAEKGKTREWISNQLDVTERTVSRWSQNQNQPDLLTLAKIAEVLGVRLFDLVPDLAVSISAISERDKFRTAWEGSVHFANEVAAEYERLKMENTELAEHLGKMLELVGVITHEEDINVGAARAALEKSKRK